jgi:putative transposase
MNARWNRSATCVYNIGYHVIWCPKYRKKYLRCSIEDRLKTILIEKATEMACTIDTMEVMPDHIHIFIKCPPTLAIAKVVQGLKGYSSRLLRQEFPLLAHMKSLWTRSYYCETVGHISQQTVTRYIEDQKKK